MKQETTMYIIVCLSFACCLLIYSKITWIEIPSWNIDNPTVQYIVASAVDFTTSRVKNISSLTPYDIYFKE